jgi:pimeloyl-CoA dehydrogenase large subunit
MADVVSANWHQRLWIPAFAGTTHARTSQEHPMDLNFTKEEIAFRDEVRTFFKENVPPAIREKLVSGRHTSKDDLVNWQRILNKKGWAVPHWPKEYGGTGWSPVQQYIFLEELQSAPAPSPLPFGVNMVGPVIYTFGNEEQKKYYLPRIANLDDWWCQGFSEPGSGSDLASLKTTAKRKGDVYIINGQKTWTTLAQHADWIFCLCRTDPDAKKQSGISFILFDMKSRGVTVRPIQTIDGGIEVNEVFFDDVEVPVANLVGEENKGWDYAKFLLGNERTNIARVGMSKERIRRIRDLASKVKSGGKPLIEDSRFREKLAATEIELKALELTQMRVVANESKNGKGKPDPASSILKIKGSEIQQTITELLLEITGPFALPFAPEDDKSNEEASWATHIAPAYFNVRKVSIYGGSNEIQRNIITKAVLGL